MKKLLVSLFIGLVLGGLISYFFLDYQDKSYEISNYYGVDKMIVKEWDWDFIAYAGAIVFLIAVLSFIIWTVIEKRKNTSNVGFTVFKPTGVRHDFPHVDLVKQQVTCTVSYKEKTYMTVIIDLKANTLQVQGDVSDLGDLSMDRDSYIDMFKNQAKFFIENSISNPKEYYDNLIKQKGLKW